jgi:hypothetical protein
MNTCPVTTLVCIALFWHFSVTGASGTDKKTKAVETVARPATNVITGLVQRFPVSVALPKNFVVMPIHDDVPDLDGGLLWGEQSVLEKFKGDPKLDARKLTGPVFVVTISDGVIQTGRDTFNVEGSIKQQLNGVGVKDVAIKKTKWGEFPVLHFRGVRSDGRVSHGAWVGFNSPDGFTMFFDFRSPSSDGKMPEEDEKVWETFLTKTK